MPTVTYNGASYACTTAIKGDTYIRLLDAEDAIVASFEGITDLSKFSISGGSWSNPEDLDQCCLVVMRRDGTLVKTTKKVCDVGNNSNIQTNRAAVTPTTSAQTVYPDTGYDAMSKVVVNAIPSSYVKPSSTKGATEWTPSTSEQYIAAGTYCSGKQTIKPIPSSYVKPSSTQGAKDWMPSTIDQTISAGTYCSGKQTIKGDVNLLAENIRSGVTLFGIPGAYEGMYKVFKASLYADDETAHSFVLEVGSIDWRVSPGDTLHYLFIVSDATQSVGEIASIYYDCTKDAGLIVAEKSSGTLLYDLDSSNTGINDSADGMVVEFDTQKNGSYDLITSFYIGIDTYDAGVFGDLEQSTDKYHIYAIFGPGDALN